MTENVFTFAELDFLLSGDPSWGAHRDTMHLPPGDNKAVQLAGLASLLARGLARVDGAEVEVVDEVAALVGMLQSCTEQVSLAVMTGEEMFSTSTFAFSPDRQRRMLNSTVAPGVVEVRPLRPDVDLLEMLTGIALSVVEEQSGVLALAYGETMLQIQHQDGSWSWGTGTDRPTTKAAGEDEIRELIEGLFGPGLEG